MSAKFLTYGLAAQIVFFQLLLAAEGSAQDAKNVKDVYISLNLPGADIAEVFAAIEAETEYSFVYDSKDLPTDQKIYLATNNQSVANILVEVSRQSRLRFKQVNNTISVNKITSQRERKVEVVLEQTISGQVTDLSTDEPLPGVNILAKGTATGTVTDVDGNYRLTLADEVTTLVFSSIGYETLEESISGRTTINIALSPDIQSLSEVVVVGYGTQKKSDLTGSVASVSSEELAKSTIASLDQGLAGRAPGVQVTQQTGQPGGATSIRIRGGNSINSSNEPLYVIDGFPYFNDNNAANSGILGGAPAINALATLNPGDIESIEILKDASATAIYGSRGANGVILITTKRGKAGQSNIDFQSYFGVQEVIKTIPVLNARQYAEFRNDAFVNARGLDGQGLPTYSDAEVAALGEGTNWQDEIFRTAPVQNYQLSFTGGGDKIRYAVSANYFDQEGIVIGSNLERYSLRANIDADLNKRMRLGNNFTASYVASDLARSGGGSDGDNGVQSPGAGNIIQDALFYNPVIPVLDEDGNYTSDNASDTQGEGGGNQANTPNGNPVAFANLATQESITTRLLDNLFVEYDFLENLTLRVSLGADVFINKQNSFLPSTISQGAVAPNGAASVGTLTSFSWLNENTLNYSTSFTGGHDINLLAGVTAQRFWSDQVTTNVRDLATDVVSVYDLSAANIIDPPASNYNEWSLFSYLFRANYSYKSKYLLTLSGRVDGSSRFGPNNKYGFFPSAAVAYRISDEPFIQNIDAIDDLKLRLSAGVTGNQEIPTYRSLSILNAVRYPFNNESPVVGFTPQRLGNPDIQWETTSQIDFGIDLALFSGRINFTSDLYYKRTDDLLLEVRLPFSSGFANAFRNIGSVENRGIELSLGSVNIDGDFTWTTDFNIAFNRNKVLNFGDEQERFIGDDYNLLKGQAASVIRVGEPIGNFVGYINDGIIRNQDELDAAPKSGNDFIGSRRFMDLNDDGIINDEDRTVIGNALPDFTGGFQNTFRYKNFDLDIFFQFSYGNEIYNMTQLELEFLNGRQNNSTTVLDRFIPGVNEDTDVARAGNPPYVYFRQSHTRWIEDGSFLRLRNLTFGYNLPTGNLGIDWLRSARVYFNGQNLWLLSDYRGYDPEVNINPQSNTLLGIDYASYPSAKLYTVGINLGF
ncbi:MAG: TonB-dependent receptor [Bacteroidota bacterium]